jgi:signal transduction histidine kinase
MKAVIQFNHHTTRMNEWELMDVKAIDLHRQPDLPQRLDVLFESLQDGFGKDVLISGNFLALGYDAEGGRQVFARFVEFGKNAQAMLEVRKGTDIDAAVMAFDRAKAGMQLHPQNQLIIQIPYFIREVEKYVSGDDISLQEFQQKFDNNEVIFTSVQKVSAAADVRNWLEDHSSGYEQRFVFTLGLHTSNGIANTVSEPQVKEALGYFMGSFLSWAGMGVADSTRYMMAAAAARLAHYSHEFLKPFGELQDFLNTHAASVPPELSKKLVPVLANVKLLELSSIALGFSADYYSFKTLLKQALANNTTFSVEQELADGGSDFTLAIRDVRNRHVYIDFQGLPDDSVNVKFDPPFFDRLIRNLLRNAVQHSRRPDQGVRAVLSIKLDNEYGLLTMCFKHLDSKINRQVSRLLFRMPIPQSESSVGVGGPGNSSASKGIGLWTVGMSFEAQRLPLPVVLQEKDDVSFIFRFPMETS